MKKLVLLICLLFPFYVFADNLKFGTNYAACIDFQSKKIITSGAGKFNYCNQVKCENGFCAPYKYFKGANDSSETIVCSNGNKNYWSYEETGCTDYLNPSGDKKYCGSIVHFDCSKAADGSKYSPSNTTTSKTTKRATTKRTTTKRPSSGTTTTTTTTTTVPIKDNNSFLSSLTVKGYEINFYKEKLSYEIVIDKDVKKLDISYETDSDKATAVIKNNVPISVDNPITITVTAEDGTFKDYTINLTYKALSNNINVKNLTIENYDIDFDNNKQNYDVVVNQDTKSLNFNIELEDENAKYEIQDNNDLVNGSVIKIRVIAENLTETTYNFNIIKETTTVPKKKNNFFTILLIFLILGIIGVVVFKFIRNILPAKADEKYDYE